MNLFKEQRVPILVATNLAARGLDVKDIRFVINYDFPTQIEEYVHRVGRTGRGGATGTSFTFFTEEDSKFARDLVKILAENNQKIPDELYDMIPGRRFHDRRMSYDKNYASSTRYSKGFGGYDKLRPTGRSSNYTRDDSNYHKESRHSDFSREFKPSFEIPTTIPITSLNKFNSMNDGQTPTNAQQYNLLAQMHMMQMMQKQFGLPAKLNHYSLGMALQNPSLQSTASKMDHSEREEINFEDFREVAKPKEFFHTPVKIQNNKYSSDSPHHEKHSFQQNGYPSHKKEDSRGSHEKDHFNFRKERRMSADDERQRYSSPPANRMRSRGDEISSPSIDGSPVRERKDYQREDSLSFSVKIF